MAGDALSQPNVRTFTPEDIVAEVIAGRVRVPSFQRKLRWQWEDVRRLFDSIAKGYPIGNLLLWERDAEQQSIRIGALDIEAPSGKALFVVDGQQRVTSLANALTERGASDPRFSLAFDITTEKFEKLEPDGPAHLVPLYVIFDLQRLLSWFAEHPEVTQKSWFERATRLAKAIRQYAIPAYVVKQQDEKVLRDIFDRMNNYGRRLSRAEVFSALHGGDSEDGADAHISAIADSVAGATGFGRLDDDTVLLAFLARRGSNVARDIRRELGTGESSRDFAGESAEEAYRSARDALERAVRFLQTSAGVPHFGFLPYRYLIVVLTRFFALHPEPSPRNAALLRRFVWRAALAGPMIFQGWTNAMRTLGACIWARDETGSVQRLLAELKEHSWVLPRLTHFRTNTAETRIVLCALWSLRPMSPVDGSTYDLDSIAATLGDDSSATNALKTFFPHVPETLRGWAANRAILLEDVQDDADVSFVRTLRPFDASARRRILKSHALDKRMLELLEEGGAEAFLRARHAQLGTALRDFVERMTETRFEDTPPLDDLLLDEDDGGRDDEVRE